MPFPKGWSRVVATQRHLNEGAAGKTTLHRLDARREASIRRSRCGNSEAIFGEAVSANQYYTVSKSAGHCPKQTKCAMYQIIFTREGIDAKAFAARTAARLRTFTEISPHTPTANQDFQVTLKFSSPEPLGKMMSTENLGATARLGNFV